MNSKIKLSLAVAGEDALPNAFVVYRGFETSIKKAAELGYNGIELALKSADEIDPEKLSDLLLQSGLEVSCISTGQVFAELGYMFTSADKQKQNKLKQVFKDFIDLAQHFSQQVNIGRVRGTLDPQNPLASEQLFIELAREICDYALDKDVTLLLEPVNRYEINFINNVTQGVELMKKVGRENIKLMPDVFHMNIEDATIGGQLAENIDYVGYIHLADSNRYAPGQGHTDFDDIFEKLKEADYKGWVSVEILPQPDPDTAAAQAADFLKPYIDNYNK